MTRFRMEKILKRTNIGEKEARRIGRILMDKYVLPNLDEAPVGRLESFLSGESSWETCTDNELTASVEIYGYFSQAKVRDYQSPYIESVSCGDSSEIEENDTVVKQKEKTDLSDKATRKMKAKDFEELCNNILAEENLVAYRYEQIKEAENGLVHFKITFKFWS